MRQNSAGQWELDGVSYGFVAVVDGRDLVVQNVKATWFGGDGDLGDDGRTFWSKKEVNIGEGLHTPQGCALPLDGATAGTMGSPLPFGIPCGTQVRIYNRTTHLQSTVALIDIGPNKSAGSKAAIDLTQRTFLELGGRITPGIAKLTCARCRTEITIKRNLHKKEKCSHCGLLGVPRIVQKEGGDIPVDFRIIGGARFPSVPTFLRQV